MARRIAIWLALGFPGLLRGGTAQADTLGVGPGKTFTAPCAAFAAASDGDTVEIDARGSYDGDVCTIAKNSLTIRGSGGRAHIDAAGKNAGGKAIWIIQGNDAVVEDIELSGCSVPDQNGAGIRQEGRNLTVRHGYFHDNQNGILGDADPESVYLFEDSEFARNGAGDGQSHNMYIGEIKSFTLSGSYSHDAKVGHLVKSRALRNLIQYSRLTDEDGTASYQVDLPEGGVSVLIGNVLQKSAAAENAAFVSFAREARRNPDSALWVVGNTFFNTRSAGTFVAVASDIGSVTLRNNVFAGPGTACDLPSAVSEANFSGDPQFVDAAGFDFRLGAGSPAVDQGVAAGMAAGVSLLPVCQYVHPAHAVVRTQVGAIDPGAFELEGETSTPCGQVLPSQVADAGASAARADAGTESGPDAGETTQADAGAPADGEPSRSSSAGCALTSSSRGSPWAALAWLSFALALTVRARRACSCKSDARAQRRST